MPEEQAPEYTFADFALADNPASLDQDHPLNANLRDGGIGLVPRVLNVDAAAKCATLGCGSITAMLTIPLGWHIFDDGKRTLVFDEGSTVQVNFNLVNSGGLLPEQMIEQLIAQLTPVYEGAKWITMELGGMKTLAWRGVPIEQARLDQVFMFMPSPLGEDLYLQLRATASQEDIVRVMDMVELILRDLRWPQGT